MSVEIRNKHQVKKLTLKFLGIKTDIIVSKRVKLALQLHLEWTEDIGLVYDMREVGY